MRLARLFFLILMLSSAKGPMLRAGEPAEPKAPQAGVAVQAVLDEADRLLSEKKPQEALAAAERALTATPEGSGMSRARPTPRGCWRVPSRR